MTEPWGSGEYHEPPAATTPSFLDGLNPTVDEGPAHVLPDYRASRVEGEPIPAPVKTNRIRDAINGRKLSKNDAADKRLGSTRKVVPNKPGQFLEPMEQFYMTAAMVAMPFRPDISMVIMSPASPSTEENPEPLTVAQNCAKAWDEAAQRSESLRRFLDGFLTVGVLGALIAAHAPILMAAVPSKFNPAAAMEEMLKKQAEA